MARLFVLVEGETEETFVEKVLAPHLLNFGYARIDAKLLGNQRQRSQRGGIRGWSTVRREIEDHLKEDRGVTVSLMVDYYGLPQTGDQAWPRRADSEGPEAVEAALQECVAGGMGGGFDRCRFQPLVMMHEFEAMLFSDCTAFGNAIERPELIPELQAIRDKFENPEEIDDSPKSAPSKRIHRLFPGYEKPHMGTQAALKIGLERIRAECPHLRAWLKRLEQRGGA